MNSLTLLAVLGLGFFQESPESLIEKLATSGIDGRSKAAKDLLDLGAAALPALRKAIAHPDPEISGRAKPILARIEVREQLTPALRAMEGLDARLAKGGDGIWTEFFLEAIPWRAGRGTAYSNLQPSDLEVLIERAIRGAKDEETLNTVLVTAAHYKLRRGRVQGETLIGDRSPRIRAAAARMLVLSAREDVMERVEPLLQNPQTEVRAAAIEALGEAKVKAAIPRLVSLKGDPTLRLPLGVALIQLGSKEGAPLLMNMGGWKANLWLSNYPGPELLPYMREQLKHMQTDPNAADGALVYLGRWGDRGSVPLIEQAVRSFRVWGNNSRNATIALFHSGAASSTVTLLKLCEGNGSETEALGWIGNRDAIPGLRAMLAKDHQVAAPALALGELGDKESIPALRKLLTHPDTWHRSAACTALALLDDADSAGTIADLEEATLAKRIWPRLKAMDAPDVAALQDREDAVLTYSGDSEYRMALRTGDYDAATSCRSVATMRAGRSPELLIKLLGKTGNDSPALVAAATLTRMGRKEGLASLLDEEKLLFSLNALRQPEAWARLEAKTTTLNLYAPYEQIHRALAKEAGLELEAPPAASPAHKAWTDVHLRFWKWGRPATLAEAFDIVDHRFWSVVLEKDRIRILPHDEALAFWKDWAKALK